MRKRIIELKIKIASLAAEARIIHANERKAKRRERVAETRVMLLDGLKLGHARKRLLVDLLQPNKNGATYPDVLSNARAELADCKPTAPKVPREVLVAQAAQARDEWDSLREHRKFVVATEARTALLAYAFLRGRSYASQEVANTYEPPNWSAVRDTVIRFGGSNGSINFGAWVQAGVEHLRSGHDKGKHLPSRLVVPDFAR